MVFALAGDSTMTSCIGVLNYPYVHAYTREGGELTPDASRCSARGGDGGNYDEGKIFRAPRRAQRARGGPGNECRRAPRLAGPGGLRAGLSGCERCAVDPRGRAARRDGGAL